MAGIKDLSIVDSNTAKTATVPHGTQAVLCSAALCGSSNLTVFKRTVAQGRAYELEAGDEVHVVYVMNAPAGAVVSYRGGTHPATDGAGVLLAPSESARFEAAAGNLELLHMVTPRPPAAVEAGLPGGPGYYFDRTTLRVLSDASGGRVRRFCAESSVKLRDGSRLTPTNAIQAGEMHYHDGGASPYHLHRGTPANPAGAAHCYMTFKGRGAVEVEDEVQEVEPGTLIYFPPGVPHRLRAKDGPLDYFEIQAWRSFKTTILSEDPLGLKWYYESEAPGKERVEWNQE